MIRFVILARLTVLSTSRNYVKFVIVICDDSFSFCRENFHPAFRMDLEKLQELRFDTVIISLRDNVKIVKTVKVCFRTVT